MKWLFRLLTLCSLGFALIFPFFIKDKAGNPMATLPSAPSLPSASMNSETDVYKWQDDAGNWHYSDKAPSNHTQVETITVSNHANIIQSLAPEEKKPQAMPTESSKSTQRSAPENSTEDVLSFDRLRNIIDETHAVKDMMEQRNQALNEINGSGG